MVSIKGFHKDIEDTVHYIAGSSCSNRIRRAFEQMQEMIENGHVEELSQYFHLSRPLNVSDPREVALFYSGMALFFTTTVENRE